MSNEDTLKELNRLNEQQLTTFDVMNAYRAIQESNERAKQAAQIKFFAELDEELKKVNIYE